MVVVRFCIYFIMWFLVMKIVAQDYFFFFKNLQGAINSGQGNRSFVVGGNFWCRFSGVMVWSLSWLANNNCCKMVRRGGVSFKPAALSEVIMPSGILAGAARLASVDLPSLSVRDFCWLLPCAITL